MSHALATGDTPKTVTCGICRTSCGKTPYRLRLYNFTLEGANQHRRGYTLCPECMARMCDMLGIKEDDNAEPIQDN